MSGFWEYASTNEIYMPTKFQGILSHVISRQKCSLPLIQSANCQAHDLIHSGHMLVTIWYLDHVTSMSVAVAMCENASKYFCYIMGLSHVTCHVHNMGKVCAIRFRWCAWKVSLYSNVQDHFKSQITWLKKFTKKSEIISASGHDICKQSTKVWSHVIWKIVPEKMF